jgi:hypothetical protein
VWDVTVPSAPALVPGGAIVARTPAGNRRTRFPTDVVLEPGRSYRVLARVLEQRNTAIDGPVDEGPVRIQGGIGLADPATCDGAGALEAPFDRTVTGIAFRFGTVPADTSLDPVGTSLVLGKDGARRPVLGWADVGAAGYVVSRCRTGADPPCTPERHAVTTLPTWTDLDEALAPREMVWYLAAAVNECTAGL